MKKVLITGASGLIGQALTEQLLEKNYQVSWLSRKAQTLPHVKVYTWDIGQQRIDEAALDVDAVIHLAGENVGQTWTAQKKIQILESRTLSTRLLAKAFQNRNLPVFVSASGIGLYGDTGSQIVNENAPAGNDFLAKVVVEWEKEIQKVAAQRTAIIRIGVVLSKKGGALEKMATPVRFWAGAALGSGKQYLSWIHEKDICNIFMAALENPQFSGAFNAVAPNPVTNYEFTQQIADILEKPFFLPNVPNFVLKTMLGEMSEMVLNGTRASCEKLLATGFRFEFSTLSHALKDLL